jgi:hypothetical protein
MCMQVSYVTYVLYEDLADAAGGVSSVSFQASVVCVVSIKDGVLAR